MAAQQQQVHQQEEGHIHLHGNGQSLNLVAVHYGPNCEHDVTAAARTRVSQQGGTKLEGNTNELFGDVAPGVHKKVRVIYTVGNTQGPQQVHQQEEGNLFLDPPGDGALYIVSAHYGPNCEADVTMQARAKCQAQGGRSLNGNTNELFGDPYPGVHKRVRITYQVDAGVMGPQQTHVQGEGPLDIHPPSGANLYIASAHYGPNFEADVTATARMRVTQAGGKRLAGTTTNELFGDPFPGVVKRVRIVWSAQSTMGPEQIHIQGEGPLTIEGHGLHIVSAHYGPNFEADVTAAARGRVQAAGRLAGSSTNEIFGDPVPGVVKRARVIYQFQY